MTEVPLENYVPEDDIIPEIISGNLTNEQIVRAYGGTIGPGTSYNPTPGIEGTRKDFTQWLDGINAQIYQQTLESNAVWPETEQSLRDQRNALLARWKALEDSYLFHQPDA